MSTSSATAYAIGATPQVPGARAAIILIMGIWFTTVFALTFTGAFMDAPGGPPISIVWANAVPLTVFFALYAFSPWARSVVRSLDISLLAGLHALRTVGLSFLVLAGIAQLPWLFAIPAGVGDIMVAVSAPFIAYNVVKSRDFIASNRFMFWNIFGVVDFFAAVGTGSVSRILGPEVLGAGMEPMSTLPLVMIPAFLVPMFMIGHIIMLMRAFEARKNQ